MRRVLPTLIALALPVSLLTATAASAQTLPSVCKQTFSGSSFTAPAQDVPHAGQSDLTPTAAGHVAAITVTVSADGFMSDGDGPATLSLKDTTTSKQVQLATIPSLSSFDGATFDDAATAVYDGGEATGAYKPASPLSVFKAAAAADTWQLTYDNSTGIKDVTVSAWSVTITYANCVASSRISIARHAGKVGGTVTSTNASCKAKRAVTVYRVRSGHRHLVGHTKTTAAGAWHLKAAKKSHTKYYAVAAKRNTTGAACGAATSRKVR